MDTEISTSSFLSSPVIGLTWIGLADAEGGAGAGCCARQMSGRTAERRSEAQARMDGCDIDVLL
jgi:hypothetical protein